jgi:hypothetical protein
VRTISREEFSPWCNQHGLQVADREWVSYANGAQFSFTVKLQESPYKVVAFARSCFLFDENVPFEGAMIWFRDWGIWSREDEETFSQTIQMLRANLGEHRPLMDAPGHIFSSDEFVEARVFWTQPMIIGWDAILLPEKRDYFVFTSHDEVTAIVSSTLETHSRLIQEFKDWGPVEDGWYFH